MHIKVGRSKALIGGSLALTGIGIVQFATAGAQEVDPETGTLNFSTEQSIALAKECFENARDYSESHESLMACELSLEEEALSKRRRAAVYANRGVIHFNLGNYIEAASDFTESLNLGIHVRARILTNRGLAYEALGEEEKAKQDYDAALAINPNYPLALKRRAELEKPLYERSPVARKITAQNTANANVEI